MFTEAKLLKGDESWWVSSDGTKKDHWSGTTMSGKCACGATGSCYKHNRNCNCDEGASYWMQDKGYITSRTDLPVSQIRAGDTSSSKLGFITLGSLKCYERGEWDKHHWRCHNQPNGVLVATEKSAA